MTKITTVIIATFQSMYNRVNGLGAELNQIEARVMGSEFKDKGHLTDLALAKSEYLGALGKLLQQCMNIDHPIAHTLVQSCQLRIEWECYYAQEGLLHPEFTNTLYEFDMGIREPDTFKRGMPILDEHGKGKHEILVYLDEAGEVDAFPKPQSMAYGLRA